jgi:hypothetical protein
MAKWLNIWRYSPTAPWPTDPVEMTKLSEMMFAMLDSALKQGALLEFGYFPDGTGGYAISEGEAKDQLRRVTSYAPWIIAETHEMIPYETGKEIVRGVWKAQAEAMAAMKR